MRLPLIPNLRKGQTQTTADALPVDLDALLTRCGGNEALASKLVAKFCARLESELTELIKAFTAGDAVELASLAHRLKGAAATLSAEPLRALVSDLEQLAKQEKLSNAAQFVENIKREAARLKDYVTYELKAAA